MPVVADRDSAWGTFTEMRATYEPWLAELLQLLDLNTGDWIGDDD